MTNQEFTDHLVSAGSYRSQLWVCEACGATGEVLFHKDDTPTKQQERLGMSHHARRNRVACPAPVIVRIERA